MPFIKAGKINHFFDKIQVAVVEVTNLEINIGDTIRIGEEQGGFEEKIESMQVNHQQVETGRVGDEIGLKVTAATKPGEIVYKMV